MRPLLNGPGRREAAGWHRDQWRWFARLCSAIDLQIGDRLIADQDFLSTVFTLAQVDIVGPARPFLIDGFHDVTPCVGRYVM